MYPVHTFAFRYPHRYPEPFQRARVQAAKTAQALDLNRKNLVLPNRIELSTSPLPRECSTTELRQLNRKCQMRPRRIRYGVNSGQADESARTLPQASHYGKP